MDDKTQISSYEVTMKKYDRMGYDLTDINKLEKSIYEVKKYIGRKTIDYYPEDQLTPIDIHLINVLKSAEIWKFIVEKGGIKYEQ